MSETRDLPQLTQERGQEVFKEVVDIAQHWQYPSGDFRYDLRELAQTLRGAMKRITGVDILKSEFRQVERPDHRVAFHQPISNECSQVVCACGDVLTAYHETIANAFGRHLKQMHDLDLPTPPPPTAAATGAGTEGVCTCGHAKVEHSNAREHDFGCNVPRCYSSGKCSGFRTAPVPVAAPDEEDRRG